MADYRHSVSLEEEKCIGCTHCLRRCPTEAIRIRDGHAVINASRCIDCGMCIQICPQKAKHVTNEKFSSLPKDKYTIALPAPSLYAQFDNLEDVDIVLQGLLDIGFNDVYEVSRAAELVSEYTRRYMKRPGIQKPVISSACPVITRLISLRYPYLCDNVLPIASPLEVAAKRARKRALEKNPELSEKDICVCFISPCAAKASFVKANPSCGIDMVFSMRDIYVELLGVMKQDKMPLPLSRSGRIGIGWAAVGGEATAVLSDDYLSADGIDNCVRVLEEIDNGSLDDVDFIELNACTVGCVGGCMTVVNPFIAHARMRTLRRFLPISRHTAEEDVQTTDIPEEYMVQKGLEYSPVSALTNDRSLAISLMSDIEKLRKELPGLDCGSCGSPTCAAFAADVVRGLSKRENCCMWDAEAKQ